MEDSLPVNDIVPREQEYRFIYNPALRRRFFWQVALVNAFTPLFGAMFGFLGFSEFVIFLIVIPLLILFNLIVLAHFLSLRSQPAITLDATGFTSRNALREAMGRHALNPPDFIAWDTLAEINMRKAPFPFLGHQQVLEFVTRSGAKWFCPFKQNGLSAFVGDGHTRSLPEVIALFYGPVAADTITADTTSPAGPETLNVEGESAQIAMLGVIMALAAMLLMPIADVVTLETAGTPPVLLYGITALGVFGGSFLYTRRQARALGLTVSCFCAATAAWLMLALSHALPSRLGEAQQETFAIQYEDDEEQRWQNAQTPEMTFSIYLLREGRVFRGIGTKQTLPLYRGPLGLVSIDREAYRALYHADRAEEDRYGQKTAAHRREKKKQRPPE